MLKKKSKPSLRKSKVCFVFEIISLESFSIWVYDEFQIIPEYYVS